MQKFSIILPVHNGGEYIKECVQSILSQSLQDFNLIILDNASNDGTLEWLRSLHNEKIIIHTSNKFLTIEENWSRIIDVPKNEFITLIGHDDLLQSNFLQIIKQLIISYPEASLYHTHFNYIDANGRHIRPCKPMKKSFTADELLQKIFLKEIDIMGTGYVMRSKDYDSIKGIPVNYPSLLFADFELWHKIVSLSYEAIAFENCFSFRIHQSTTTTSQDNKLHKALQLFIEYLSQIQQINKKENDVILKYVSPFLLFYCKSFCHRLLRTPLEKRNGLTIKSTIKFFTELALKLNVQHQFTPEKILSIKLAIFIDNNILLRKAFLLSKKLYKKPLLK